MAITPQRRLEIQRLLDAQKNKSSSSSTTTSPTSTIHPAQFSSLGVSEFKPGILDRIKKTVSETASKTGGELKDVFNQAAEGSINPLQSGIRTVGSVLGGAGELLGSAAIGTGKALLPKSAENAIGGAVNSVASSKPVQDVYAGYQAWKEKHPEGAKDLEAVVNIASVLPMERVLGVGIETGLKSLGKSIKVGAEASSDVLRMAAEKQAVKDAVKITAPKLTTKEAEKALASGRGKTSILGTTTVEPSTLDVEVAKSVQNIVKGKSAVKDIQAIRKNINLASKDVEAGLAVDNKEFSKDNLRSVLGATKDESRVIFGSDKTLESTYDAVVDEMMRQIEAKPPTLLGAWEARKAFDQVIDEKFPNLLSGEAGDNVRRNAVKDVRRAMNDFIESGLPEGVAYKTKIRNISNMFEAVENISSKEAAKMGENIIQRAAKTMKNDPAWAIAAGLGFAGFGTATATGTLGAVLTNPAVLSILVAGGTYRVGKKVLTSKIFKETLSEAIEKLGELASNSTAAEAAGIIADQAILRELYDSINSSAAIRKNNPKQ